MLILRLTIDLTNFYLENFKCIIAEDGATGLRLAEEYRPNAMLDVGLPQLDGWAVMASAKSR